MASSRNDKRTYSPAALALTPSNATTGVWASQLASNVYSFHKAAAGTTSVVNISVPKTEDPGSEDNKIKSIAVQYKVSTANLTSAPTAVLNKITYNADGTTTRAAVTQTLAFSGLNAVGTAIGDYWATVTITTPAQLADNEDYVLALTMNEAATSVLDINAVQVDYTG